MELWNGNEKIDAQYCRKQLHYAIPNNKEAKEK